MQLCLSAGADPSKPTTHCPPTYITFPSYLQFVNLPILAAWLMFHFATRTEHLYAALCLAGLGGGLMEAPVSESQPH